MSTKKRIDWIDVAKGIGMICVILAHVEETYISNPYLRIPLYTFHMPLFFFLSGYLFSVKSSFKEFLIGKCRRILVPYFCLGGLLILFDIYWHGRNPFGDSWFKKDYAMYDLTQLLLQKKFLTLWFIACLFWLSILFYVLVRFIKNEIVRAIIITALAVAGLCYYHFGGQPVYWNLDVCLTALPFFYVGFLCKKTDFINEKILKTKWKPLLFVGFIAIDAVCAMINLKLTGQHLEMYRNEYAIAPLTYLGAFAAILAVIILSDVCNWFPLRYIGVNSMIFYAWHQTMMMPLVEEFFNKMDWFEQADFSFSLGIHFGKVFTATLIICVVLSLINEILCRVKLGFIVGK